MFKKMSNSSRILFYISVNFCDKRIYRTKLYSDTPVNLFKFLFRQKSNYQSIGQTSSINLFFYSWIVFFFKNNLCHSIPSIK
ncbi:Uncharacterised protein [Mycobacterium tuberculosis]|nr:Uncharacterised protein [Mycobacterium tuberculosis]